MHSLDHAPAHAETGAAPQRWHELDALRAFVLVLGVVLHATLAYFEPRVWILKDEAQSQGFALLFYVIHMLRMTTFFVLAGFFARLLMHNRSLGGFTKNRLMRIALPLGIFWPVAITSIVVMMIIGNAPPPGVVAKPPPPPPAITAQTFPLTHLWFLYLLLFFYGITIVLKIITDGLRLGGLLGKLTDAIMRWLTRCDLITALLILPAAIALYLADKWYMWFGIPTPDTGLMPHPAAFVAYFTAYGFGWWLHRNTHLLDHLAKRWWTYLLAAILGTALSLNLAGVTPVLEPVKGADHALYIGLYLLASWSWVLALIGAARRFLTKPNAGLRYMADASYWIYIVHLPLVLLFQYLFAKLAWPAEAKLPAVVFSTLASAIVTYALIVRYSFIGTILNGKRRRPTKGQHS